jgi:ferredoxin
VYVREESCIGCGFCEKVCPVSGRSAIIVEGIQPQVMTSRTDIAENSFFPASVDQWQRKGKPVVYAGKDKLFEYINGGAETYLSFSFIQVSTSTYTRKDTEDSIKVDVWEFGNSDDAYGVYTKDKTGKDIRIGNEAALYENYLWIWKGKYFIGIEPYKGNTSPDDVIFLATSIINNIATGKTHEPAILKYLPEDGYIQGSSKFFHKKINLDNIYISDKFMKENILNLSEETDAAIAEYKTGNSSLPFKIMIIKYRDKSIASESFNNFIDLRKSWGDKSIDTNKLYTFEDPKGRFSSISCLNNYVIATFLVDTREDSETYVNKVMTSVKAYQN